MFAATDSRADAGLPASEPGPGISHALARWRSAHYRDIRYVLSLELAPPFERVRGTLSLRVVVPERGPDLVLDWRPSDGAAAQDLSVNGALRGTPALVSDHIVVPHQALRQGENLIELRFESPIRVSGAAVTRFHDPEDGSDYLYSLVVPADASSLFPCFDQPDLKARFELSVTAPHGWRVIGNGPELGSQQLVDVQTTRFAATEPISTYLFAFAAGPFEEVRRGETRLFVRRSRLGRAQAEAETVLGLTRQALDYFQDYFACPFPFAKYDLVLIPDLAYSGMEHAGATFLREDSVLFPFDPALSDRLRRASLIFHETAHQWFGDLVTMRWFDDLWLKEGFANFMAAKATAALISERDAWNTFRALKTAAYRTDATHGTSPIRSPMANLAGAKSAYGSIVYSKAPAVLRQAEHYLGEETFRAAVRGFLADHAFDSADWNDLVGAFERASGRDLRDWAGAWVTRRGLPRVRTDFAADPEGDSSEIIVTQEDALGEGGVWPMRVQLAVICEDGRLERLPVLLQGRSARVSSPCGGEDVRIAFANDGDFGYGLFLVDAASRAALLRGVGNVEDDLLRALLWDALWESVRAAELSPLDFLDVLLRELPRERDQVTAAGLLSRLQIVQRWYLSDAQQLKASPRVESVLRAGLVEGRDPGMRLTWFRSYAGVVTTPAGRDALKGLLSGKATVPGATLSSNDRFRILRRLITLVDPDADGLLARQAQADVTDEGRRQTYAAGAARPDAAVKRAYFDAFLTDRNLPERWTEEGVAAFNAVEQEQLTLPYLEPALRELQGLQRTRKIFFVNNWLIAFVGGQRGAAALATVQRALERDDLEHNLRLKLIEAGEELERTVRIRARYAR